MMKFEQIPFIVKYVNNILPNTMHELVSHDTKFKLNSKLDSHLFFVIYKQMTVLFLGKDREIFFMTYLSL